MHDHKHHDSLIPAIPINWLRALKRPMAADSGKYLGTLPPFAYCKARGIGWSKAVKTVVPSARVRVWSRGRRLQQG